LSAGNARAFAALAPERVVNQRMKTANVLGSVSRSILAVARSLGRCSVSPPIAIPEEIPAANREESASAPSKSISNRPPFSVVVLEDAAALQPYVPAWDDLAAAAVEPNVFYESWMLLPALRAYGAAQPLSIVLVFANDVPRMRGQPLLCGLFPLERQSRLKGLVPVLRFWHYLHCYLGVPLVRGGFGRECLRALFDWLGSDARGAALLECAGLSGDGSFYHLLLEYLEEHQRGSFVTESYTRALLRPGDSDGYLERVLSGDKRKKLRRAEQRLAESGPVQYVALADDGDLDAWLSDFLRLEASGWKGREGTALSCQATDRDFFLSVARSAFQQGRLHFLALQAGGQVIAQQCNFLAGAGSFAFKVAFDEEYARFSPGVLLELENIRHVHARPQIGWMDSCSMRGESLVKHLWADRRVIHSLLVETGRSPGPFALAALPMLRWLRRLGSSLRRSRGSKN
jgi:CelD/BcsL family acetyltransferase involved in cellulose biosynthesis